MNTKNFLDVKGPQINVANPTVGNITEVASLGFKLVRLPFVGKLDIELVRLSLKLGMKVIVDYHPDIDWWKKESNVYLIPYIARQTEELIKEFSVDEVAIEFLNEPRMDKRLAAWNKVIDLAIKAIREISPNRWIILQNHRLGDIDWWDGPLGKFSAPKYTRIICSLHYYRPFANSHPKAYLDKTDPKVDIPLPFPPTEGFNKADYDNMDFHIKRFKDWCVTNGCLPVIGEFGFHEFTLNRIEWFEKFLPIAQKYKIPVQLWSYQDEFGIRPHSRPNQVPQKDYEQLLKLVQTYWT